MKTKHSLRETDKSLLILDVWPVHIAKSVPEDFLPWIRTTHPNVIVLFVPGGCKFELSTLLMHHDDA